MKLEPRRSLALLAVTLLAGAAACTSRTGSESHGSSVARTVAGPAETDAAPDAGTEITREEALAVFDAAWQAVNDTHFDPQFNGVDWAAAREEFRPRAAAAATREELRSVIDEMLGRLGQSHFAVLPAEALPPTLAIDPSAGDDVAGGLGFDVRWRDAALVSAVDPGGPADEAGVRTGWILRRVGDLDLAQLAAGLQEHAGEHLGIYVFQVVQSVSAGPIGSRVETVFQDAEDREVTLELERVQRDVVAHNFGTALPTFYLRFRDQLVERDGKEIGVIHFTNWFLPMMKPIDQAVDRMRGSDGIVFDLRGNTGGAGTMVMGVAGHFFPENRELGVMTMRDSELRILAMSRRIDAQGNLVDPFAGPVAIVTDETTGSASEFFAGGMQSVGRARVFGETSAGAVLPATTTPLPGGDVLLHALGDFVTADGTRLEGRGVVPDEVVPLERAALLAGEDPQLEAALAWIAAQSGS